MQSLAELVVHTQRLCIRPVRHDDLKQILQIHQNSKVNQYLPYETWRDSEQANVWFEQVQERRSDGTSEQFVIECLDFSPNTIIGTCLAFIANVQDEPELSRVYFGYVLAEPMWRHGFMFEAMQAFVPVLREKLNLSTLFATVETANQPSIRLLERLGFTMVETQIDEDQTEVYLFEKEFS